MNAKQLKPGLNDRLLELNALYAEMGQKALTDYDQTSYHSHEIINIVEGRNVQVFFQTDNELALSQRRAPLGSDERPEYVA